MSSRLIAHLAHVEVITPNPADSLRFYRDVLGLEGSGSSLLRDRVGAAPRLAAHSGAAG